MLRKKNGIRYLRLMKLCFFVLQRKNIEKNGQQVSPNKYTINHRILSVLDDVGIVEKRFHLIKECSTMVPKLGTLTTIQFNIPI
ncbi:MAG: hypothetical protein CMI53_04310 [Parcubacteria group bacterium]|nr:hypothetical protein [Parcubacteria group bacterium]